MTKNRKRATSLMPGHETEILALHRMTKFDYFLDACDAQLFYTLWEKNKTKKVRPPKKLDTKKVGQKM